MVGTRTRDFHGRAYRCANLLGSPVLRWRRSALWPQVNWLPQRLEVFVKPLIPQEAVSLANVNNGWALFGFSRLEMVGKWLAARATGSGALQRTLRGRALRRTALCPRVVCFRGPKSSFGFRFGTSGRLTLRHWLTAVAGWEVGQPMNSKQIAWERKY
jgi:hypothetical protein